MASTSAGDTPYSSAYSTNSGRRARRSGDSLSRVGSTPSGPPDETKVEQKSPEESVLEASVLEASVLEASVLEASVLEESVLDV
jgi:hypothetical protein